MSEWFEHLAGIAQILPIGSDHLKTWPEGAFAQSLQSLRFIPVVESELFLVSHHLPLKLRHAPAGWEVIADLRSDAAKRPAFNAAGMWQLAYRPLALRLLPFAVSSTNSILRLVGEEETPVHRNRTQMEAVQKHIIMLYNGRKMIASRVEKLLAERWLELVPDTDGYQVVPRFKRLSELQITSSNWGAAELLIVLAFSQKQLLGQGSLRQVLLERQSHYRSDPETRSLPNFLHWDQTISFDL